MAALTHFAKIIRWPNLLIIAITQYMVAVLLISENTMSTVWQDKVFLVMVVSTILIAGGGYLINDYYDIKIDYINKPGRVVAGRFIKRRNILFAHTFFTALGIAGGVYVSIEIGLINIAAAGMLWLYSNQLKRLPFWGNLSVAVLTGLSVYIVYMFYHQSLILITSYAAFAFFISLIREILKDLEDIKGDEAFGCKTLPITLGIRKTKNILYMISFLFLLIVAYFLRAETKFVPVFSGLIVVLALLNMGIYKADKTKDFRRQSGVCKVVMILGLLSMLLFI
jgi:4-hydroxybenzoate polyprenyltransferase